MSLESARQELAPTILSKRWDLLEKKALELVTFRLSKRNLKKQYVDCCLRGQELFEIARDIKDPSSLDNAPNGILGEVFFLDACNQLGIYCCPTTGDEDAMGADFKIRSKDGIDTRFLDVTINITERGLKKKNKAGTFPTVFIPWYMNHSNRRNSPSYARHYLATGEFDSSWFMRSILAFNYDNLRRLEENVWKDSPWGEGYMAFDGITYVSNLAGVLEILKGGID